LLQPWQEGREPALAFPNAHYVVGRDAWGRAKRPHPRDRASFIPQLPALLEDTGRLEVVDGQHSRTLGDGYRMVYSDGHTPGLMLTRIESPQGPITFMGDLVPGVPWVHLPITMGYDRFPELLIDEKHDILGAIHGEDGWCFFTHDAAVAAAKLTRDERGRFGTTDAVERLAWR
ncbi:MAG: MBL fold metallo-hydrolase, partial [Myxococcota bacterium]